MAKFKAMLPIAIGLVALGAIVAPRFIPAAEAPAVAAQPKAADFALPRSGDGKTLRLSDYKGKVRIVNFWATWCPPCRAEIPHFIEMYDELKGKGVEIIGISMDREGDKVVAPFVKDNKMNYPVVIGNDEVASAYGGIRGIPTTFIVDREGRIVKKYVGLPAQTEEGIKAAFLKDIKPLL